MKMMVKKMRLWQLLVAVTSILPSCSADLTDHQPSGPEIAMELMASQLGTAEIGGIYYYTDINDAREKGKEESRPLLLDFNGWACVNSRKFEDQIFTDVKVREMLQKKVIYVRLYVDDKTVLPESEQRVTAEGYRIKTIGNKNSNLQKVKFGAQSQPYFALMDDEFNQIGGPATYESHGSTKKFDDWLSAGLEKY